MGRRGEEPNARPARRFRLGILGLELVIELTNIRPSSGCGTSGSDENRRELPRCIAALHRRFCRLIARSAPNAREITQIYEGTNQIQRMVMARNLLRG
jgi:alkylation response protein AidB-like acyl-CoA dehydrogenase